MKTFGILLAAAFATYFTPMEAHNQQKMSSMTQADKKIYVSPENLYFGNEGIFWQASQDNWVPVSGVNHDSQGIYLARGGISWDYYVCNSCGKHFASEPSECDVCGGTSFEYKHEDIWDRRT